MIELCSNLEHVNSDKICSCIKKPYKVELIHSLFFEHDYLIVYGFNPPQKPIKVEFSAVTIREPLPESRQIEGPR